MTESAPEVSSRTTNDWFRNKWIILGVVALAAIIATVVTLVLRSGSGLKPDQLNSMLLDASEINTIMGTSDMQPGELQVEPARPRGKLSNPDCLSALTAAQFPTYASSGYTASRWGWLKDADIHHYVVQAVSSFPDAEKANAFVKSVAAQWKSCEGTTVTVTGDAVDTWLIGTTTGEPPSIALMQNRTDVKDWANQRAMRAVSNVVIDVSAAGYDISDQGATIAGKIAANVGK